MTAAQAATSNDTTTFQDTATALPLTGYGDMVVDLAHGHIFISGGSGGNSIVVTDLTGAVQTTITSEPGAEGLVLSPDGSTLYAALSAADAISEISTTTLAETARISTGTATVPTWLAYTGGEVWFSYGAAPQGGIGDLDPATSAVSTSPTVTSFYTAPRLAADSSAPGVLIAGEVSEEPSTVAVYDVSSGSLAETAVSDAWGADECAFVNGLAITADGSDVLTSCGGGLSAYKLADYSTDGSYNLDGTAAGVAIGPDGTIAEGLTNYGASAGVDLFTPGDATPVSNLTDDGNGDVNDGVAWGADSSHLYTVSHSLASGDSDPTLNAFSPAPPPPPPPPPPVKQTVRIAGSIAIMTAIAGSQENWADSGTAATDPEQRLQAQSVVLSRSDAFYDALAGSALAVDKSGPMLITPPGALYPAVLTEIERILPTSGTVYLLGGTAALSPAVATALTKAGYTHQVRFAGTDVYDTAIQVDKAITGGAQPTSAIVATGLSYYDALSAGAAAGASSLAGYKTVVVLTKGGTMPALSASYLNTMTPNTSSDLNDLNGTLMMTAGGPGNNAFRYAVSNGQMPSWGYDEVEYVGMVGTNAPDTAVMVAQSFFADPDVAAVATVNGWYDGLSGGAFIGTNGGPLLLTAPSSLSPVTSAYISTETDSDLYVVAVLGGTAALPQGIVTQIDAAMGGDVTNHGLRPDLGVGGLTAARGRDVVKKPGGGGALQSVTAG